eukprot:TRINITY_DN4441_c0_g1_i4.p1 TRINITY_DN4441_c0_g1~~TRINITY_DN4441_c0_g1_i4.p1  ORF type:complete len:280 (-),score=23.71 TRINITY_DN4441_c0_g1_i4:430-1215(-)
MISVSLVVQLTAITSVQAPPSPLPIYHSKGPNQILLNEGQNVKTVSGQDFLSNVTSDQCAVVCSWLQRKCDCCNSFSYRPEDGTCYLKKRDNTSTNSTKISAFGWQSYWYWGLETVDDLGQYNGGLPDIARTESIASGFGGKYSTDYVSFGGGKVALVEGQSVLTQSGTDRLVNVDAKNCAEECNAVPQCDGFSYNPQQNQGTCFLKKNSSEGKFITKDSVDGWTFYWKENYMQFESDCFCPCQSLKVCIMCLDDGTCDTL